MMESKQLNFLLAFTFAGLPVGMAAAADQSAPVFTKDVLPILERSCQNCHRPGQIGPFSMLTYKDTRPWAKAIKQQVVERNMPPWYIDKTVGIQSFKNDISLSKAEIDTIARWVDAGAPEGNLADAPPPRHFDDSDRWHIGTPDVIVHLSQKITVKADSADQWLDIDTEDLGLTSDRYVTAVEMKPFSGSKVVHHASSSILDTDSDEGGKTSFAEYAVGKYGDKFPEGVGVLLKKDSKIQINLHLHADKVDTPIDVAMALKLMPEGTKPKYVLHMGTLATNHDLDIPPNTKDVRADGYQILPRPAVITSFQPHMHNRGQAQCLELIEPTNGGGGRPKVEMVSCVDRFKFDWHVNYEYSEDAEPIVPAGTVVHQISFHDNTAANPSNPDPSNWVTWGERTADEMDDTRINYYFISEEEYKARVAARAAAKAKKAAPASGVTTSSLQPPSSAADEK
jgi:hypothetical protein